MLGCFFVAFLVVEQLPDSFMGLLTDALEGEADLVKSELLLVKLISLVDELRIDFTLLKIEHQH